MAAVRRCSSRCEICEMWLWKQVAGVRWCSSRWEIWEMCLWKQMAGVRRCSSRWEMFVEADGWSVRYGRCGCGWGGGGVVVGMRCVRCGCGSRWLGWRRCISRCDIWEMWLWKQVAGVEV